MTSPTRARPLHVPYRGVAGVERLRTLPPQAAEAHKYEPLAAQPYGLLPWAYGDRALRTWALATRTTCLVGDKSAGCWQYEPTAAQPQGQPPPGAKGTAPCAPRGGWQYEPTAVQP